MKVYLPTVSKGEAPINPHAKSGQCLFCAGTKKVVFNYQPEGHPELWESRTELCFICDGSGKDDRSV